jgi:hypothetical protein
LGGYRVDQIALALVLVGPSFHQSALQSIVINPPRQILVALEEWSDGNLVVFPSLFPIIQEINSRVKEISQLLSVYKTNRPKAWLKFCQEVHDFAAESRGSSLSARPIIHLSSSDFEQRYDVALE